GRARVCVANSVFVLAHAGAPRRACTMFRGWFAGALEFVGAQLGNRIDLASEEIRCAAQGPLGRCVFEIAPKADR
ncbi:MAG TPA: 4-vinyl reductase, partial [Burkholderiales bacterium]|nr:4-vinyl reductase [Burkholderiales bacterium]